MNEEQTVADLGITERPLSDFHHKDEYRRLAEILIQILNNLPAHRDWLDPNLERMAKAELAQLKVRGLI